MSKKMTITPWLCNSCACVGLQDLGLETDAHSAMMSFCKLELISQATKYSHPDHKYNDVEAFYVFIAGPEIEGTYHSKKWVKYGSEFAAFIEANGLGTVVTPGKTKNRKHHPSTDCQTWVWMTNKEALIKWWEAQQVKEEAPTCQPEKSTQ